MKKLLFISNIVVSVFVVMIISMGFYHFFSLFVSDSCKTSDQIIETIIYQPEHNHVVSIATVKMVTDTTFNDIHALWYKDQVFLLDTTDYSEWY